jgi:zinc/manganese transport system substrate-binding protein
MSASRLVGIGTVISIGLVACACGSSSATATPKAGTIAVVAAENQYGNVASQIGGRYVTVSSVESNPNTDPHSYEVSPGVASEVASAQLVIENGAGYDDFMTKVESASPNPGRRTINVQQLRGLPDDTPNPHLWYDPKTMPAVAEALATDMSAIDPAHASTFRANAKAFITSLNPWIRAIASFEARYRGAAAATTEPVADYLLMAMGIDNLTPFQFQADIMNGTEPSPQDITLENRFFTKHQVRVFCYNQQVVDALTSSVRTAAQRAGVPIVGVYETMPTPSYDYQRWMLAEVNAIENAVAHGISTEHL